jgi:L-ectoine synthase
LIQNVRNVEGPMIVRTIEDVSGTSRDVRGPGWRSRRLILKDDGMGYSVHDTVVNEGSELRLHYKHHLETNYCIAGEGEVMVVATGITFAIKPGALYALDQNDEHVLRALRGDLRLVCVFSPALSGRETHAPDGSYSLETS